MSEPTDRAEITASQAYQAIGALWASPGVAAGVPDAEWQRALDYFSGIANGAATDEAFLPWPRVRAQSLDPNTPDRIAFIAFVVTVVILGGGFLLGYAVIGPRL